MLDLPTSSKSDKQDIFVNFSLAIHECQKMEAILEVAV